MERASKTYEQQFRAGGREKPEELSGLQEVEGHWFEPAEKNHFRMNLYNWGIKSESAELAKLLIRRLPLFSNGEGKPVANYIFVVTDFIFRL